MDLSLLSLRLPPSSVALSAAFPASPWASSYRAYGCTLSRRCKPPHGSPAMACSHKATAYLNCAKPRFAEGLAARAWDDHRHTDRRQHPRLPRPDIPAVRRRCALVLYTTYGLTRPVFAPMKIGVGADIAIGVSNGFLGGLTGLGGVISTIVPKARLPKDVQRAVFQPVLFVAFVVISISQAVAGTITNETLAL
jgi:hypothetical protein